MALDPRVIPTQDTIYGWIEAIFLQGIRRPAYPADQWTEQCCVRLFDEWGLEHVRLEPVELPYWEPRSWSLRVRGAAGHETEVPCFPLPHSNAGALKDVEVARFDEHQRDLVRGRIAVREIRMMRASRWYWAPWLSPSIKDRVPINIGQIATWTHDPRGTLAQRDQVLPFGPDFHWVMEPVIDAGAVGFIGVLADYPGGRSFEYYVPYDTVPRPIPGVWISAESGAKIGSLLDRGPVRATLDVEATRESRTSHNVVAELPGADEDTVIIGSHHDGPWGSAVEDASGVALVLAQARYWSQVPRRQRPHRLTFLVTGGHMAALAGIKAFVHAHAEELPRIVLEVHLEHAAAEFAADENGDLVPTGEPEPRYWFTTRLPHLERIVREAVTTESLDRSLMLPPDALAPRPPTDGGHFHPAGVPWSTS